MNPEDVMRDAMARARRSERPEAGDWDGFVRRGHRALLIRRAVATGLAVVLLVGGAVAANTLLRDTPVQTPNFDPAQSPSEPGPQPTEATASEFTPEFHTVRAEIWGTEGELLGRGVMEFKVTEDAFGSEPDLHDAALEAAAYLIDGSPLPDGLGTAIPDGLDEFGYGISEDNGILTFDLPAAFESGGGSLSMQMRVAQLVFTVTQSPEVEGVLFMIEGEPRDAIGGEGIDTSEPLTRRDFDDLAPAIVVDTPEIGDEISSPVTIAGTANVFEANVILRILDENGEVLVETFTTATCGTGCRGEFSAEVEFEVDHRQDGTVEALTYSAEDGSPQDVVSIPVTLVP